MGGMPRAMGRSDVAEGILRALPLGAGIASLGLVYGASMVAAGFPTAAIVFYSATVFAGAAQFATLGAVAAGAGVLTILGLVLLLNARYFLMSAATLELGRKAGATPMQRILLALGVVDESYALQAAAAREGRAPTKLLLAIPATLWVLWIVSSYAGTFLGGRIPDLRPFGLDYLLPGIFVGLLGVFADTRERLLVGIAAFVVAGAMALAGQGRLAVLLVPPLTAFAMGRWGRAG